MLAGLLLLPLQRGRTRLMIASFVNCWLRLFTKTQCCTFVEYLALDVMVLPCQGSANKEREEKKPKIFSFRPFPAKRKQQQEDGGCGLPQFERPKP